MEEDNKVDQELSQELPQVKAPKAKNPKRVEQGRRLAEWNKKNKEKLKIEKTGDSPVFKKDDTNYWIIGGIFIAGGIVVGLVYFTQRGAEMSSQQISSQQMLAQEVPVQQIVPEQHIPAQEVSTQQEVADPFEMV